MDFASATHYGRCKRLGIYAETGAMKKGFLFTPSLAAATLIAAAALVLSARPAQALPNFAEAYGVTCSTCHTTVPQLNAYGRYVQRTGYAALSRDLIRTKIPVSIQIAPSFDTSSGSGHVEVGNAAAHFAGYISPSITAHVHQWFAQDGETGGLDTMQLAYNFKNDLHLFAGKLSALPVPAPFSNGSDLSPYATAELQVGEHMYQSDMMRWGAALSYVGQKVYTQVAWFGANTDWDGATDYSSDSDKTFQYIAAYADPGQPLEAGIFGSAGSLPLAEGGVDHYNTIAAYVQRDPGPKHIPGVFAVYQIGNDANPGNPALAGMGLGRRPEMRIRRPFDGMAPAPMAIGAAHSHAFTLEGYEGFFHDNVILGLRKEMTDDGLGNVTNTVAIDLGMTPIARYQYLHLYFEGATQPGMGPVWKGMAWWQVPLGAALDK